jgi:hypothetical protein
MTELQDIFAQYGESFRLNHRLLPNQLKVMRAIKVCRTTSLGGHIDACAECGFMLISYNSCRNRHCPKCQTSNKERRIEAWKNDLLNVSYFHVVFTIPDRLNPVVYQNQRVVYDILFKAVSETLSELASDKKYLGAQMGFTAILHTWGQNLTHHPHIHCIVTGGGLNSYGRWVNSRRKFFIPVKVLKQLNEGFCALFTFFYTTLYFFTLKSPQVIFLVWVCAT